MDRENRTDEKDEWTPRERGISAGALFAENFRALRYEAADGEALDPLALAANDEPLVPPEIYDVVMKSGIRGLPNASAEPDSEKQFWTGFRDGVRSSIVELNSGLGRN